MASNISSGDRRWAASARKSGMTILGKVPKPINLPSQRSENNGLDPNVEIVPKGTLTWGSRPSSAASNVWASSTLLSPKTDGSTGSPCHNSGRPSSGGSGTRPSTAGSDRSQDSSNAWGSNSRPSTASGLLPSNQAPVLASRPRSAETRPIIAARPRSAETRPGSSQLSRFADNVADPAVAWGSPKTADKLGIASAINHEFSLSSGDFPTLGSEKRIDSQQGHTFQEHSDASSGTLRSNETLDSSNGDICKDQEDPSAPITGRNSSSGGAASHNPELNNNSQQAQPHKSLNMTPSQFDSWHSSAMHAPDKVWYRGALVSPYRPAGPPGSFPVDPFMCYPRPFPPNSEAALRPGAGPAQYHPTTGEVYRPQVLPNPYMFPNHPVIPAMPGPYHTPVPYDGYYGYHKPTFCSSGEQHMPSGVAIQPSVYKQSPNSSGNITSDEFQNSLGGDVTQKMEVHVPSDRAHAPFQGPYKVLLKPQGDLAYKAAQTKTHSESSSPTSIQCHVESKPEASISKESEESAGSSKNEIGNDMKLVSDHQASLKVAGDGMCQPSNPIISNLEINSHRTSEGILKREPNICVRPVHDWKPNSATRKNNALIEKIEGLSNKVRSAENHSIVGGSPTKQERLKQPKVANARSEHSTKARGIAIPSSFEGNSLTTHTIDSRVVSGQSDSNDLKPIELGDCVSKGAQSALGRGDYCSNSRLDNQTDGELTRESSEKGPFVVPMEKTVTEDAYSDSLDHKNQRAKMKELAAQRAKQLQKQEEERIREQKAKALAKLEELNRRSAALSMKSKSNEVSSLGHNLQQQEDPGTDIDVTLSGVDMPLQANEYNKVGPVVSLSSDSVSQTPETVAQDSRYGSIPTLSMEHHTNTAEVTAQEGSQFNASSGSKHRSVGYRRRQKLPLEKNSGEKSTMRDNAGSKLLDESVCESKSDEMQFTSEKKENSQKLVEVNAPASSVDILPHNGDPSLQLKKKNHRNMRNRNKDDTLFGSSTSTHSNEKVEEYPSESSKLHPTPLVMETSSVPALISSDHGSGQERGDGILQHSHQGSSKVVDEGQGRMNNHWKPQPSRKMARNHQAIRPTDKVHGSETVIWAPIRPANKIEQPEEIQLNSIIGNISDSSLQIVNDISGTKTKRAEIERYVPKPVAKEHLQQEYTQKSSTHHSQLTSDEMPEKSYLDSKIGPGKFDGSSEFGADTKKTEDNKPGRRGRVQTSWRQRNSADTFIPSQASNENVQPSDATETFDKTSSQHLPLPGQVRSDGWESDDNLVQQNAVVAPVLTKNQGIRSMQKHQQAHRVTGSNYGTADDHNSKNKTNDKNGGNPLNLDTSENDVRNSINDNGKNAVGEHVRSHWKPKSQIQKGRGTGGQPNFYHDGRPEKFGYPGTGSNHPSNETSNTLNLKDHSRNSASSVEQMHNRRPVGDANPQPENQISPPQQYRHHNGRVNRGQEATYRGRDFMHTSGKSNAQRIEDQHKNTPHFEYQPVDSYSKPSNAYHQSNSNIDQEAQGHHASRQKYKEHYHTQSRNPGRFTRGTTSHVDDSHNGEE